jgi:hypothetical protein
MAAMQEYKKAASAQLLGTMRLVVPPKFEDKSSFTEHAGKLP